MSQMPVDLQTHTAQRLGEVAGDTAKNLAARELRRTVKQYVPKMFWPLIPGERGTVEGNVKSAASKWFWGMVSSAVFSLVFFAVFGLAVLGTLAVIGYAVVSSM
ncbi:MAG: hypothetical protein ABMA64_11245 [Myxococcota bacterium]